MTWEQIDKEFEAFPKRFEYIVEEISLRLLLNKDLRILWMPDLKDISTEPFCKEVIRIYNGKIGRLNIGLGYNDEGALAERTYSMRKNIKYNFSEWKIINKTQLN